MSGELGTWLGQQQAMREQAKAKAYSRWTWGAVILILVPALVWFGPGWLGELGLWISMAGAMGVAAWGWYPIQKATKELKTGINSAIARSLGINFDYEVVPGAEFEASKTYGLVPGFDRSGFEDRWHGALEGHDFNLYEAHLEDRRGSGKNRHWVTVFRGVIIKMGFGRDFHSATLLQRAGKHQSWFGLGGRKDFVNFGGHRLDYVDQVHPDFEDIFEVWSDDQVEARVLVHPSYIEHLLELERVFEGEAIRALFRRGEVILAVESRTNLFESGHINATNDAARAERTGTQFSALAGLAVAINQNERGRTLGKEL
jgi:hypothetical protein